MTSNIRFDRCHLRNKLPHIPRYFFLLAVLVVLNGALAAVPPADTDALRAIYDATQGSGWKTATGWLVDADPCNWYGVRCNVDNTTVVSIGLARNNLNGTIPSAVGSLVGLQQVMLSSNPDLSGQLPPELAGLTQLQVLDVAECSLSGEFPIAALPEWRDLQHLNVGHAMLPISLPVISGLHRLNYVPRSVNHITGDLTTLLSQLPTSMTYIGFGGTRISGRISDVVCRFTNLEEISLRETEVSGTIPPCMGNLKALKTFDFSATAIGGHVPSGLFASDSSLEGLVLATMYNLETLPQRVSDAPKLRYIMIQNTGLRGYLPVFGNPTLEGFTATNTPGLVGGFPSEICDSPNVGVMVLSSIGVDRPDGVPTCVGKLRRMWMFILAGNPAGGPVPDVFSNWTIAAYVMVSNKWNYTGPLPLSALTLPRATNVAFDGKFSGRITAVTPSIKQLSIRGGVNTIFEMSDALCAMTNLEEFTVQNTTIHGTLPECIGQSFKKLKLLIMSDATLSGSLPQSMGELESLQVLRIFNTRLSGALPPSMGELQEITELVLRNNSHLASPIDMIRPLQKTNIVSIDMSHNLISGAIPNSLFFAAGSGSRFFPKLFQLKLGYNNITGVFPVAEATFLPALRMLDLRNNALIGPVTNLPELDVITLANNKLHHGPEPLLPAFLTTTTLFQTDPDKPYRCPKLTGSEKDILGTLDPSYYDYEYCQCNANYYGKPPNCNACPDGADCSQGILVVPRGLYPASENGTNATHPEKLIRCSSATKESNPCNDKNEPVWRCKEGHTDRLCGACTDGYFRRGPACLKCPPTTLIIALFLVFILFLCIVIWLLRKSDRVTQMVSIGRIMIFYLQAIHLLKTYTPLVWAREVAIASEYASYLSFSPTIMACITHERLFGLEASALTLTIVGVVSFGVALLIVFVVTSIGSKASITKVLHRGICGFLGAIYIPLSAAVLAIFVCDYDSVTKKRYVRSSPANECDGGTYYAALAFCVVAAPVVLLGFPAYVWYNTVRVKDRLRDEAHLQWFGSLYAHCPNHTWHALWNIVRRFLLSIVVTAVPEAYMLPLLMALLIVIMGVHLMYRPYNYEILNYLESGCMWSLLMYTSCGAFNALPGVDPTLSSVILMSIHFSLWLTAIFLVVVLWKPTIVTRWADTQTTRDDVGHFHQDNDSVDHCENKDCCFCGSVEHMCGQCQQEPGTQQRQQQFTQQKEEEGGALRVMRLALVRFGTGTTSDATAPHRPGPMDRPDSPDHFAAVIPEVEKGSEGDDNPLLTPRGVDHHPQKPSPEYSPLHDAITSKAKDGVDDNDSQGSSTLPEHPMAVPTQEEQTAD